MKATVYALSLAIAYLRGRSSQVLLSMWVDWRKRLRTPPRWCGLPPDTRPTSSKTLRLSPVSTPVFKGRPMTEPRTEAGRIAQGKVCWALHALTMEHNPDCTVIREAIVAIEREAAEACTCDSYPGVCPFHGEKAHSAIPPDHHSSDPTHRCPDCGFKHCPDCGFRHLADEPSW